MELLSGLLVTAMLCLIVAIIVLAVSDCDLILRYCETFGQPTSRLFGKVAWVTGASSGIGQAIAVELAQAGCRLVISARREDRLKETKEQCLAKGQLKTDDIFVLPLDLLDLETHAEKVDIVIKYFKHIDILVNNAGVSQRSMFDKTPLEVDKQLFDIDVFATISLTKTVLPYMTARGQGHILVTSSVAGKLASPGQAAYTAAKHAIQGYFDTIRIEYYPRNIKVTLACPGPVHSEALYHAFTETPGKVSDTIIYEAFGHKDFEKIHKTLAFAGLNPARGQLVHKEKLEVTMLERWKRMTSERCARLMVVALANNLDEVWVTTQPELFFCYLFQYLPYLARKAAVRLGQDRANKIRSGQTNLRG